MEAVRTLPTSVKETHWLKEPRASLISEKEANGGFLVARGSRSPGLWHVLCFQWLVWLGVWAVQMVPPIPRRIVWTVISAP
eukprot:1161333-Pelagomonas_calceolata.AAC.8